MSDAAVAVACSALLEYLMSGLDEAGRVYESALTRLDQTGGIAESLILAWAQLAELHTRTTPHFSQSYYSD